MTRIAVALWAACVLAAMAGVWRYKREARAAVHEAPLEWPAEGAPRRVAGRATVVMFAHPHCPCTRASISELAVLMTALGDRAVAHVLFAVPDGVPEGWERTDTWARASALPGVTVAVDVAGAAARAFGATASGHTVVYDTDGRRLFAGGITSARGHAGDNAGRDRITALVAGQPGVAAEAPTFGCGLASAPAYGASP